MISSGISQKVDFPMLLKLFHLHSALANNLQYQVKALRQDFPEIQNIHRQLQSLNSKPDNLVFSILFPKDKVKLSFRIVWLD